MDDQDRVVEQIWVNVTEAAKITGYNRQYVVRLAQKISQQPEEERPIKLHKRTNGYDLWLPDLIFYIENLGHGPHAKPTKKTP